MADVLLIKANSSHLHQARIAPPLGLMYLAAALRERGHRPKILDMRIRPLPPSDLAREIKAFKPDLVGLSAFSVEMPKARELAGTIRREAGFSGPLVLGGPHASAAGAAVLSEPLVDFALAGEGEIAFPRLVEALAAGNRAAVREIPGLFLRENGGVVSTGKPRPSADVNLLPHPAWDLVDVPAYFSAIRTCFLKNRPYMPVFTSRGCPYGCIYCHNIFGKRFRARSPENVLSEMETLVRRYGVREFEIQDDIFNFDRDRAAAVCEGIIRAGWNVKISFPNGLRCDILPRDLLALMRRAGAYFLAVAVETASPRLQKMIRKNLDLAAVERAARDARDLGVITIGNFMLGFPGETRAEILETIRFACSLPLNFASFMTVTPFSGTRLAEACRKDTAPGEEEMHFYRTSHNLSSLSDAEFFPLRRQAYRRFYAGMHRRVFGSGAFRALALGRAASHYIRMQLA